MTAVPQYARPAARVVLGAALIMSAPGEYELARLAGWGPWVAGLMPVCVSVYAAVAATFVDGMPKGSRGRGSAAVGALLALGLALCAQMVAHLIAQDYMGSSAFLVAATSAVPPIVVAHLIHLTTRAGAPPVAVQEAVEELVVEAVPAVGVTADSVQGQEPQEHSPEEPEGSPGGQEMPQGESVEGRKVLTPREVGVEEIRKAVESLVEADVKPSGRALGERLGVSARTGRRYLRLVE